MATKIRASEIVTIFRSSINDLRTKLPVSLIKKFNGVYGTTLYFQRENGTVIVTTWSPQRGNLLFSVSVDVENRARLSEANLKEIGATFGDKLKFEFIDRGKATVNVQQYKSQNERRDAFSLPEKVGDTEKVSIGEFEKWDVEIEQSSIKRAFKFGAGFGDPETNRKVERAAISFVTKWYKSKGWKVSSVEAEKRGYDLLCVKGAIQEHVEVKGVQGELPAFIITAGEVRQAQNNSSFVICIVTSALKKNSKLFRYVGTEFIKSFDLTPLAYKAVLLKIKNG